MKKHCVLIVMMVGAYPTWATEIVPSMPAISAEVTPPPRPSAKPAPKDSTTPAAAQKTTPSAPASPATPKSVHASDWEFYKAAGQRNQQWDDLIEPGFQTFEAGNTSTAFIFLQKAYDRGCRDPLLLLKLGILFETQRQYPTAATLLVQAANTLATQYPQHPEIANAHMHAGRALTLADESARALPYLEAALKSRPDDVLLLLLSAQALRDSKRHDDALARIEAALQLPAASDPKLRQALLREQMADAFAAGKIDVAEHACAQLFALNPRDAGANACTQRILQEKQKAKEMEVLKKIVE